MPNDYLINANIIVCETILEEKHDIPSAIRIADLFTVGAVAKEARFTVLTILRTLPGDVAQHTFKIDMVQYRGSNATVVAGAPESKFNYGYRWGSTIPGGFRMTTNFNLDLTKMGQLGTFYFRVFIDGAKVTESPFTLARPR